MRMLVIDEETDLRTLRTRLVDGRVAEDRAEAALRNLQALNPHVDLARLPAGTVLLVPESNEFKPSASDSPGESSRDELRDIVRSGFQELSARLKSGNEGQNAEAEATTAIAKSRSVKKILEADPELDEQVRAALVRFKEERSEAEEAERALETMIEGTLAELASLEKLVG
jgi:hypothetical protein